MKKLINLFALVAMLFFALSVNPGYAKGGDDCCSGKGAKCESKAEKSTAETGKARSCSQCAAICEETLSYLEKKGGKYAEAGNIQKLKDCITLCKASADLQNRQSPHAKKLLEVCHQVCLDCAKMCQDLNDPKLADCVKSCQECSSCCEG